MYKNPLYQKSGLGGDTLEEAAKEVVETTGEKLSPLSQFLAPEKVFDYLQNALLIAFTLVVFLIFYRLLRYLLHRLIGLQRRRLGDHATQELDTLQHLLQSILFYVILFTALVSILSILGFDMRGLIASAGVAGLVIAFVSQSIIKDWISGFFILIERQYVVGEWVEIANYSGHVRSISLRATVLNDAQNRLIYVPNGLIEEIVNYSRLGHWAFFDIRVAYQCDVEEVLGLLEGVAERVNHLESAHLINRCEVLGVQALDETGLVIRLRFGSTLDNSYPVLRTLRLESKKTLDAAGIPIPTTQIILDHPIPNKKEETPNAHEAEPR